MIPVFVFDGDRLPAKAATEAERRAARAAARRRGLALLAEGNSRAARKELAKSIDVTPEMAQKLIQVRGRTPYHAEGDHGPDLRTLHTTPPGPLQLLVHERIEFIVAPYEADAQLGFMYRQGIVDLVITEDSDALPYGCRCVKRGGGSNGG